MEHLRRIAQVVISRNYRGDMDSNVIENFFQLLLEKEDESQLSPIVPYENMAFVYIKYNNVYRKIESNVKGTSARMSLSF